VVPGSIYVEQSDGSSGIRVVTDKAAELNSFVNITGVLITSSDNEKYVDASDVSPAPAGDLPKPFGMSNLRLGGADWSYVPGPPPSGQRGIAGAVGLNNVGLLVNVWGRVSNPSPTGFYMNDGSGVDVKVSIPSSVTPPQDKSYVRVTGISSCWQDELGSLHRMVRVRNKDDINTF
jgi:hypothetical protein